MVCAIEMHGITKIYTENNLRANDAVDLTLRKGEILCLAGENGAGKTTLMKVLYGLERSDEGSIKVMGKDVNISSPLDANRLGIGMVHQHFMLVDDFTVAQNVVMGVEPTQYGMLYNMNKANEHVAKVINDHHFSIEAKKRVRSLTVGQKQQAEIVKMLYRNVDILILDEPTAVLTEQEIESLFNTLRELARAGKSLILITHKLNEIKAISDRVAVMRQGRMIGIYDTQSVDEREISRLMMGQSVSLHVDRSARPQKHVPVIRFDTVSVVRRGQERPLLKNVSFSANTGEILGFAGVGGNGLGVLEAVLGGLLPVSSGTIYHGDNVITHANAAKLRRDGLAYVPADRLEVGSALGASVAENLIIDSRASFSRYGVLDKKKIAQNALEQLQKYSVKGTPSMPIGSLSGGNMQKVILAREIGQYKDYIVLSEPTWGLDIASSQYVYERMVELRDSGAAVILISSNLDEILAASDRIVIFYRGEIVAVLDSEQARNISKEEMGEYMLGLKRQDGLEALND
jgi:general nucleoside transport system ATP-binding protein